MLATRRPQRFSEQVPQPEPDGGGTRYRHNRGVDMLTGEARTARTPEVIYWRRFSRRLRSHQRM